VFHDFGGRELPVTFRLAPVPRFLLVSIFRVADKTDSVIIVTKDDIVISNSDIDTENIAPCNHEEADTRMFFTPNMQQLQAAKT
jgi:hypothetical protein